MAIFQGLTPDSSNWVCRRALISGQVQGVGYRYATQKRALELGVVGWVRNRDDGRVEAMLAGDRSQVEAISHWFYSGPAGARVEAVSIEEQPLQEFQRFEILR